MSKMVTMRRKRRKGKIHPYVSGARTTHFLTCECGTDVLCSISARKVTCGLCVQRMVGAPAERKVAAVKVPGRKRGRPRIHPVKVPSGKPRGWHKKQKYIHTDGTVWSYGKPVESKAIKAAKKKIKNLKSL